MHSSYQVEVNSRLYSNINWIMSNYQGGTMELLRRNMLISIPTRLTPYAQRET
jgi:hypothetical protein